MTDMIEKVARALWADRYPDDEPWPSELDRVNYRGHARAAIEAMREPSEVMGQMMQIEIDIWPEDKPKPSPNSVEFLSRDEVKAIWQTGIDAALQK